MTKSRENFVRLAEKRTARTLKDIKLLGNLSNRTNYSYTEKDVKRIFGALEKELKVAKQKFNDEIETGRETVFKLED